MSVTLGDDVTRYVQAVREVLSDLPAVQREELLDDLSQHLGEVAAETDAPLSVRLGPPAEYAAELRASVGLPAVGVAAAGSAPMAQLSDTVKRLRDAAVVHPATRATLEFLPELRPGWWVLRGYLLVELLSLMSDFRGSYAFPIPSLSGSRKLGVLVMLAAVVASVAFGRRTLRRPRWGWLVVVGNTLLVLVALATAGSGRLALERYDSAAPAWPAVLTGRDGTPITNIYPYGADGRPLAGVRLYDQNGRPIDNIVDIGRGGDPYVKSDLPTDVDGNRITNAYPMEQSSIDPGSGQPLPTAGPASVPPLASRSPGPAASTSPAASAVPSPSPSSPPSPSPPTSPSPLP